MTKRKIKKLLMEISTRINDFIIVKLTWNLNKVCSTNKLVQENQIDTTMKYI